MNSVHDCPKLNEQLGRWVEFQDYRGDIHQGALKKDKYHNGRYILEQIEYDFSFYKSHIKLNTLKVIG